MADIPVWENRVLVVMRTEFDFSPDEALEVVTGILSDVNVEEMGKEGRGIEFKAYGVYPAIEP